MLPVGFCGMPLLAAGLDWLEGLLPLLFVLFWIVSQVWGVFRKVGGDNVRGDNGRNAERAGRPVGRERPRPMPPRPQQRPREIGGEGLRMEDLLRQDDRDLPPDPMIDRPPPGGEREQLARQIEEFLRETTGGRPPQRQQQPPPIPPRPATPPRPPQPVAKDRRRRSAEVSPATGSSGRKPTLRETPSIFHDMPHLAEPFATAAESVASTVSRPTPPAVTTPTAAELAALFRDPATLRQLVLVREVLDRPVGRW
jgi:hypothetical protein